MAVTIRLARHGRKKLPYYRIIAADKQMKRDGRYLELLGTVNPLTDPATVTLKEDRVKFWISQGAQASDTVANVIKAKIPGFLEDLDKARRTKIQASRAKRKARVAKTGSGKTASTKKASTKKKAK